MTNEDLACAFDSSRDVRRSYHSRNCASDPVPFCPHSSSLLYAIYWCQLYASQKWPGRPARTPNLQNPSPTPPHLVQKMRRKVREAIALSRLWWTYWSSNTGDNYETRCCQCWEFAKKVEKGGHGWTGECTIVILNRNKLQNDDFVGRLHSGISSLTLCVPSCSAVLTYVGSPWAVLSALPSIWGSAIKLTISGRLLWYKFGDDLLHSGGRAKFSVIIKLNVEKIGHQSETRSGQSR